MGGVALNADWDIGNGTLSAITAWRYWIWDPSNDRDFLGLPIRTLSQNPSKSYQWSQELRYAGSFNDDINFVVGAFWFNQVTKTLGREEQGSAAWRWLANPNAANTALGLAGALTGYGQRVQIRSDHTSAALFGQVEWQVTDQLRILPGLRVNFDQKDGFYRSQTYGGVAYAPGSPGDVLQRSILQPLAYESEGEDDNVSGQLTVAYDFTDSVNAYATYATAFKDVRPQQQRHSGRCLEQPAAGPCLDQAGRYAAYRDRPEERAPAGRGCEHLGLPHHGR